MSYFKCLHKDFGVDLFALKVSNSTDLINEKKIPLFYKECILGLQELYRKGEVIADYKDQMIWCHNKFHLNDKPIVLKHWSQSGIRYPGDLFTGGL